MFNKPFFKGSMSLENYAQKLQTEGSRFQYKKVQYQLGSLLLFLEENFPERDALVVLPFADKHLQNEVVALSAHSINYLVDAFARIILAQTDRPIRLFADYDEMMHKPIIYMETTSDAGLAVAKDAELKKAVDSVAQNGNYMVTYRAEKERFYVMFTLELYREDRYSVFTPQHETAASIAHRVIEERKAAVAK